MKIFEKKRENLKQKKRESFNWNSINSLTDNSCPLPLRKGNYNY